MTLRNFIILASKLELHYVANHTKYLEYDDENRTVTLTFSTPVQAQAAVEVMKTKLQHVNRADMDFLRTRDYVTLPPLFVLKGNQVIIQ